MTGSSDVPDNSRRRRYEPSGNPKRGMTPTKGRLLSYVAECGILSTAQVARIAGMKDSAVYSHLRTLFDLQLLDKIAVPCRPAGQKRT